MKKIGLTGGIGAGKSTVSKIFKYLKNLKPSIGDEVQLTDAIKLMLYDENVMGYMYEGKKFDCGSRHGYVNAIQYLAKEILND